MYKVYVRVYGGEEWGGGVGWGAEAAPVRGYCSDRISVTMNWLLPRHGRVPK